MVSISTDKAAYVVGDTISWTVQDLSIGTEYVVGVVKAGTVYYQESRDRFVASAASRTGFYAVGDNVVGGTSFGIFVWANPPNPLPVVAETPISITTGPGGGFTISPMLLLAGGLLVIGVIAVIVKSR